jgi:hypothetical protein
VIGKQAAEPPQATLNVWRPEWHCQVQADHDGQDLAADHQVCRQELPPNDSVVHVACVVIRLTRLSGIALHAGGITLRAGGSTRHAESLYRCWQHFRKLLMPSHWVLIDAFAERLEGLAQS